MPALIYAGILLSTVFEFCWLLLVGAAALGAHEVPRAFIYRVGGFSVTPADRIALVVIAPCVLLTWAFGTGRPWARAAAVVFTLIPLPVVLVEPSEQGRIVAVLEVLVWAAFTVWYLYRSTAVRRYYAGLTTTPVPIPPTSTVARRGGA